MKMKRRQRSSFLGFSCRHQQPSILSVSDEYNVTVCGLLSHSHYHHQPQRYIMPEFFFIGRTGPILYGRSLSPAVGEIERPDRV